MHLPALEFLNDARLTGLYALDPEEATKLADYAQAIGFAFLKTDLTGLHHRKEQFEKIGQDLLLPSWYGGNLDALHDCLTDLSWLEASGYLLLVRGLEEALTSVEYGTFMETMTSIVEFWQTQETAFWVFFEVSGPIVDSQAQSIRAWK